jgi:hypothetical protein
MEPEGVSLPTHGFYIAVNAKNKLNAAQKEG